MPTKRRAWVKIRNDTGKKMAGLSIVHKYSNVYKSEKTYETPLANGETTSDLFAVDYNTGFLTTGVDWWFLTWMHPDDNPYIWYSFPINMREYVDFTDNILPDVLSAATGAVAGLMALPSGGGAVIAAIAAAGITKGITSALFNSETTQGFKQHMLEENDDGELMEITIRLSEVEFKSKSGTSTTGIGGAEPPKKNF